MIESSKPFVQLGKSNFETAVRVADITLESMERLVDLQAQTAKEALEQSMRNVKAYSDVRNVQDFVALQAKAAQPNIEKALAYSRNVYTVATDAQARISRVLKTHISELGGEIRSVVDHAVRSAPVAEATLAAFKPPVAGNGKLASPKLASPKLTSPKLASPKLASPKLASPKLASPKLASPKLASPKLASPKRAVAKRKIAKKKGR